METPIAIVFFNRIEPLKKLVARLTEVKPTKVYLIADGARANKPGEAEKVAACREFMQKLPWDCEVKCNFSSQNMGVEDRVISGLNWVFSQEESTVLLEDDCIPEVSFFPFVDAMIERYRNEPKVMAITGTNFRPAHSNPNYDITFCKYPMSWGWATWRDRWLQFDENLEELPDALRKHSMRKWLGSRRAEWYWTMLLRKKEPTWDFRWAFTCFNRQGLHLAPSERIVQNVGMMADCTHTSYDPYDLPPVSRTWQYSGRIPDKIVTNEGLDQAIEDECYSKSFSNRIKWFLRKIRRFFHG